MSEKTGRCALLGVGTKTKTGSGLGMDVRTRSSMGERRKLDRENQR
jgi:hypothetical protein